MTDLRESRQFIMDKLMSKNEPIWKGFEIFVGYRNPKIIYRVRKAKLCAQCKEQLRLHSSKYGYTYAKEVDGNGKR